MGRILAFALLLGCASAHTDEPEDGDLVEAPTLFIPMRPQTRLALEVWFDAPAAEGSPVTAERRLVFAEGERYPDTLEVELGAMWFARCEQTGRFSIASVEGGSEGVVATRTGDASLRVTARPGSAGTTIVVRGSFESELAFSCAPWARDGRRVVDFEAAFVVVSREVRGLALERTAICEGAERASYFGASQLAGVTYWPLDASGEQMRPHNALATHPVDLRLSTRDGSNLRGGEALASVLLPMSTTVVDVRAPSGAPVSIDVVDPAVISGVDFTFSQFGLRGRDEPLTSGQRVDGFALDEVSDQILGEVAHGSWGEHGVCAPPSRGLFVVQSETPSVCPLTESVLATGVAMLVRDGDCRLTWLAPALDGGRGLGGELTFTAENVDFLVAYP